MDFGYFTLSDNRYPDNRRTPEQLIQEIYGQALLADEIGLHSAWIGEHHFNLLGCNPCPHLVLAKLAGATQRIRLAPAVVVLPLHHPLHVAEQWATLDLISGGRVDFAAGRGYDRMEYAPFGAPFEDSAECFAEGMDIVWRAWTETGKFSHEGKYYRFQDVDVRPKPVQQPLRPYIACFSKISMELAARRDWNIIFAPFAAAMVYGSLAAAVETFHETAAKHGHRPRRAMCSYFVTIADNPAEEQDARERLVRYFQKSVLGAFPGDPKTAPPTLRYFVEIVERLKRMEPGALTSNSILVGRAQQIVDDLKRIEAAGISEVIVYFNYGQKPDAMVREQMHRFMEEIAPAFDGAHRETAGARVDASAPR
jgi:alkanesulfonate monooxygenase SsuD/methylene tetrahydromethanopterin reductase-like flavin-dependent oxidoreductase (luciferase family)